MKNAIIITGDFPWTILSLDKIFAAYIEKQCLIEDIELAIKWKLYCVRLKCSFPHTHAILSKAQEAMEHHT